MTASTVTLLDVTVLGDTKPLKYDKQGYKK